MMLRSLLLALTLFLSSQAFAQGTDCRGEFQSLSQERGTLFGEAQGLVKKGAGPAQICTILGKIVENGEKFQGWVANNKDWCQLPESLVEELDKNHKQTVRQRGQACAAAQQQRSNPNSGAAPRPVPALPPKL